MHEALLQRVQAGIALANLGQDADMAELLTAVATALRAFTGAPSMEAIDAAMSRGLVEGPGDRAAATLRPAIARCAVTADDRRTFWADYLNCMLGYAEADIGEQQAAAIAWMLAMSYCRAQPAAQGAPA